MGVADGVSDLEKQRKDFVRVEGATRFVPAMGDVVGERFATNQLHGKEMFAVGGATGLVDGRDAGVFEACQGLRLALEQFNVVLVDQLAAPDDLEGDRAPGHPLLRLPHHAHPTVAELPDDSVSTDGGARVSDRKVLSAADRGLEGLITSLILSVFVAGLQPAV